MLVANLVGRWCDEPNQSPQGSESRLFWTGAHVCAAVAFLVVRLIRIGQIDGIRLGIPGPVMGTDRVHPHHLIGVDWAQNQSR